MKYNLQNLVSGALGAAVLNIIHEVGKKSIHNAPQIDEVGEQGLKMGVETIGLPEPKEQTLKDSTLAFNLLTNTLSYSMIGAYKPKCVLLLGALHGLAVGIGTLSLGKALPINDRPVTKTAFTQFATVGLYVVGGIATAITLKLLNRNRCK